ncbi:hypothetical protein [Nocardia cyriacigeorgica]|uniref:hypothetical protein n=2 Tax=Nocardia cyriacigeorgica TaxID=135487 RepID=UPI00189476FD|nr:hypothetical protein [Nocardia cyriacigeorgica]
MRMSPRQRLRTTIVALSGALILAAGPAVLSAPAAVAAPQGGQPSYPFDGGEDGGTAHEPKKDERAQRAEEFGGGLASEVIDLAANILKCGLNVVTPTVGCSI